MDKEMALSSLKDIHFLNVLPPTYLKEIAAISHFRDFKAGDVVFHERDSANNMYLIVSGAVSLKICAGGTDSKQIVTLGPGELLGWSTLTNHRDFAATATAKWAARLLEINGAKLLAMCDVDQEFGYEFLRRVLQALSKRLIATWIQLAEVSLPHYVAIEAAAAMHNS